MFFDTHTHLGSHKFDSDLPEILTRAREAGVTEMMVPATDLENARKCLQIAEKEPDVRVAVGVHPCDVDTVSGADWIQELRSLASHPKVLFNLTFFAFGRTFQVDHRARMIVARFVEIQPKEKRSSHKISEILIQGFLWCSRKHARLQSAAIEFRQNRLFIFLVYSSMFQIL